MEPEGPGGGTLAGVARSIGHDGNPTGPLSTPRTQTGSAAARPGYALPPTPLTLPARCRGRWGAGIVTWPVWEVPGAPSVPLAERPTRETPEGLAAAAPDAPPATLAPPR